MKYKLTSRREEAVTIDGLGVLPAATREEGTDELVPSVTEVDKQQAQSFAVQRGVALPSTNLPEGVECVVVVEGVA